MHKDLTQGDVKKHLLQLAIPALVGYFFHTMFNVTDTYFAGFISTNALAALSLSSSIFFMILAISVGMSEALSAIVANAIGEKKIQKAKQIALNSFALAFLLSFITLMLGLFITHFFLQFLGDASFLAQTKEYVYTILFGTVFFIFSFFLNSLLSALGDTKSFRNILIFTAFFNVLLDYIFVNYFHFGVQGIAIATLLSEAITSSYLYYKYKKSRLYLSPFLFKYNHNVFKSIFTQGLPPSVNMLMMALGIYIITYFITPYGESVVAAFGIGMRVEQIFLMPIIGLNVALLSIVAQNNGAKLPQRIIKVVKLGVIYGFIIATLGVALIFLFGEELIYLISQESDVIEASYLYMRISSLSFYAFVPLFMYVAFLQGVKRVSIIIPLSLYRQVIAPIAFFSILSLFESIEIIVLWFTLIGIIFSAGVFIMIYANRILNKL